MPSGVAVPRLDECYSGFLQHICLCFWLKYGMSTSFNVRCLSWGRMNRQWEDETRDMGAGTAVCER